MSFHKSCFEQSEEDLRREADEALRAEHDKRRAKRLKEVASERYNPQFFRGLNTSLKESLRRMELYQKKFFIVDSQKPKLEETINLLKFWIDKGELVERAYQESLRGY